MVSEFWLVYCANRLTIFAANYRTSVRDQVSRHKHNSSTYQEYYHSAMMNAVIQDAFLGRGTKSPYLAILNYMGLHCDENAPKTVPDDVMDLIGPSGTVRSLEQDLEQIRITLDRKYGRSSQAPIEEKYQYQAKLYAVRAARQNDRRKVFKMLYKDHFQQRDEEELQNQLQGIHKPQELRKVVHQLPERNRLAAILGDMDDDLSEGDIVKRKIEAINAMVEYAFVCEPLRRASKHTRQAPPTQQTAAQQVGLVQIGRPLAPVPVYSIPTTDVPVSPPPPYTALGAQELAKSADLKNRKRMPPEPCIFCGKKYTRRSSLWDHLEAHLQRINDGWVKCPACSVACQNVKAFVAHAARLHGRSFRPRIKLIQRN